MLADLPKLKSAVETQDPATVEAIAADYRQQVGADLLLVTGRTGNVRPWRHRRQRRRRLDRDRCARGSRDTAVPPASARHPARSSRCRSPIGLTVPDLLGTLSLGVLLDARQADAFKGATQSEVAFVLNDEDAAATLPPATWPALHELIGQSTPGSVRLGRRRLRRRRAAAGSPRSGAERREVTSDPRRWSCNVCRSVSRFLRTIDTALAVAALAAVMLATGLSYLVARTVTRPLGAITDMMRDVASTGDLTRKITLRGPAIWQDEDARLLATTFNTLTDSIARIQREMSQKERLTALGRLSTVIAHELEIR